MVVTDIKDTSFWKQFTTLSPSLSWLYKLLLISKIPHFESNSQQGLSSVCVLNCCYWYQRYLILKAIHNVISYWIRLKSVVTDIKDTSFWKQFTTMERKLRKMICCYWYQRYLILKAIHNESYLIQKYLLVVTDIKDTSFWKQFTT